jgi:hypothetical protein
MAQKKDKSIKYDYALASGDLFKNGIIYTDIQQAVFHQPSIMKNRLAPVLHRGGDYRSLLMLDRIELALAIRRPFSSGVFLYSRSTSTT